MAEQYQDQPFEHDFDGIEEYDNPMPSWWLAIFGVTIVWSVLYFAWYQLGPGESAVEIHERSVVEKTEAAALAAFERAEPDTAALEAVAAHRPFLAQGAAIFQENCSRCHGQSGEGWIGPNLTDETFIHGGSSAQIYRTIHDGVFEKGMPRWAWDLREDEIWKVAAFASSLPGLNLPGRKAEGKAFVPGGLTDEERERLEGLVAAAMEDEAALATGREIFATRCMPCHGVKGEGLIGPNLTDEYWLHGGSLADISRIISEGVPTKGMVPWKDQLSEEQIHAVAAMVGTLRGSDVPGKEPQGKPWKASDEGDETQAEATDATGEGT